MKQSSDCLPQNKGAPDSWCPLPWSHISIKGNGVYRLCCHSNVSGNHGVLRDKNQNPFHIGTADELRGLCWQKTFSHLYRSSLKWRELKQENLKKAD